MNKLVIGIDEAGRGALAGPVAVGLVMTSEIVARGFFKKRPLRDSKKMSEKERERVFAEICGAQKVGKLNWVVRFVSAGTIDQIGINRSVARAINGGVQKLDPDSRATLEFDGGLKSPVGRKKFRITIRGDEKIPAIALASVVAKVSRDRLLTNMAKKFSNYGFEQHKGYGTRGHYRALKKLGPTIIHRKTHLEGLPKK